MNIPKLDKEIGIEVYTTKSQGIGGRIRQFPEDFKVEEILTDGSRAQIEPADMPQVSGHGRYLICVLVKRNYDTLLAVEAVAKKLDLDQERVQIAGIKDARALTAQHMSIGRMLPEQIKQVRFGNNIRLYPLRFSNEKVHPGLLFGNQFRIVLRAVNQKESVMMERAENVCDDLFKLGGCPNFYGHQRFGTARPITHLVGKQIVHGDWENAVLTFLAEPSPNEHPDSRHAREQLLKRQNYGEALRFFPFRLVHERRMLNHLARRPRDFTGAFHRLPKKLCQLFVQAYQSHLFNQFLSQRIQNRLPLKKGRRGEFGVRIDGDEYLALPQIGFEQWVSSGEQGENEKQILEREGVAPQNFKVSAMPEISSAGGLRTALTPLVQLNIEKPVPDNANPNQKMLTLSFALRKGSYATIVLREFIKPRNPIETGF